MNITLKPITDEDIPLVKRWIYSAHVAEWYHEPEDWLMEIRERNAEFSFINHFIVCDYIGNPFGFCQYYDCNDAREEWYEADQPGKMFSIDYMIGQHEYLGKGYGKKIVAALVGMIRETGGAERIVVQPEEDNIPSCRSLTTNGFAYDGEKEYYILTL